MGYINAPVNAHYIGNTSTDMFCCYREVLRNGLQQLMDIAKSLIDYQQQYLSQEELQQLQQACNQAVEHSQHPHAFT